MPRNVSPRLTMKGTQPTGGGQVPTLSVDVAVAVFVGRETVLVTVGASVIVGEGVAVACTVALAGTGVLVAVGVTVPVSSAADRKRKVSVSSPSAVGGNAAPPLLPPILGEAGPGQLNSKKAATKIKATPGTISFDTTLRSLARRSPGRIFSHRPPLGSSTFPV